MQYDLTHLTQEPSQEVLGPIQDDEALLLYAYIKCAFCENVIELGFQTGYSAVNFLRAVPSHGKVVSVEVSTIHKIEERHYPLNKNAADVTVAELPFAKADLVFLDCHNKQATLTFLKNMMEGGVIDRFTAIVLHDTGTHPSKVVRWAVWKAYDEWIHQPVEHELVEHFRSLGWEVFSVHGNNNNIKRSPVRYRHGLTFLRMVDKESK
jgi:hypothetical protein